MVLDICPSLRCRAQTWDRKGHVERFKHSSRVEGANPRTSGWRPHLERIHYHRGGPWRRQGERNLWKLRYVLLTLATNKHLHSTGAQRGLWSVNSTVGNRKYPLTRLETGVRKSNHSPWVEVKKRVNVSCRCIQNDSYVDRRTTHGGPNRLPEHPRSVGTLYRTHDSGCTRTKSPRQRTKLSGRPRGAQTAGYRRTTTESLCGPDTGEVRPETGVESTV